MVSLLKNSRMNLSSCLGRNFLVVHAFWKINRCTASSSSFSIPIENFSVGDRGYLEIEGAPLRDDLPGSKQERNQKQGQDAKIDCNIVLYPYGQDRGDE